jgi:hypothetical protein
MPLSLADVVADAAEGLEGIGHDGRSWSVGGTVFAWVEAAAAEFRLEPLVAAAARRTPDTVGSARGQDWVRFEPAELDDQAIDRAEAWFGSAHRRALRETR